MLARPLGGAPFCKARFCSLQSMDAAEGREESPAAGSSFKVAPLSAFRGYLNAQLCGRLCLKFWHRRAAVRAECTSLAFKAFLFGSQQPPIRASRPPACPSALSDM